MRLGRGAEGAEDVGAGPFADAGEHDAAVVRDPVLVLLVVGVEERRDELPGAPPRHRHGRLEAVGGAEAAGGGDDDDGQEEEAEAVQEGEPPPEPEPERRRRSHCWRMKRRSMELDGDV